MTEEQKLKARATGWLSGLAVKMGVVLEELLEEGKRAAQRVHYSWEIEEEDLASADLPVGKPFWLKFWDQYTAVTGDVPHPDRLKFPGFIDIYSPQDSCGC